MSTNQARRPELEPAAVPVQYLTENGFTIVRRSEIDRSVVDTPYDCRFVVQREDGVKHEVSVAFDKDLIAKLQTRRKFPLLETSMLWLVCAESCLAGYLWEHDDYPPGGQLIISDLCPDDLMLALHWQDRDRL